MNINVFLLLFFQIYCLLIIFHLILILEEGSFVVGPFIQVSCLSCLFSSRNRIKHFEMVFFCLCYACGDLKVNSTSQHVKRIHIETFHKCLKILVLTCNQL